MIRPYRPKTTGELLVSWRYRSGLTRTQAYSQLYTSSQQLSKWETGKGVPGWHWFPAFKRVYKLTQQDIWEFLLAVEGALE